MQFLDVVKDKVGEFASENATLLLTAAGVVGTVATGVLAGRGGFKAAVILREDAAMRQALLDEENADTDHHEFAPDLSKFDQVKLVGVHFLPPILTGTATIAAIVMSHRMSSAKVAGLAAAYGLAERNLSEYKEKVAEKITGPKKTQITDELAQEAVDRTPGSDKLVIVEGEVLCFDKPTGRYFQSTMEQIRQAVNTTNAEIFNHGFTTLNFFYEELGLKPTTWAGEVGFDTNNLLDLEYSTIMAPGNRPCIAIDFRAMPRTDFDGPKYQ